MNPPTIGQRIGTLKWKIHGSEGKGKGKGKGRSGEISEATNGTRSTAIAALGGALRIAFG
jgi:hypothetical protein